MSPAENAAKIKKLEPNSSCSRKYSSNFCRTGLFSRIVEKTGRNLLKKDSRRGNFYISDVVSYRSFKWEF